MFGMNRKDADGVLEDVAALGVTQRNAYRGPTAEDLQRDHALRNLRSENFALATRELKTNDAYVALKKQYTDVAYDYVDANAVVGAARVAVDALADQLAEVTGRDREEVRKAAYAVMAQVYDREIGELLATSRLVKDPRTDPAVKARPTRDWYFGSQP